MGATFSSPTIEYANLPLIEDCEHSNISVHSADSHELHSCRDSFAFYTGPLIAQPQSTLFTDAQQSAINSPSAQASFSSSECKITSFFPSSSISSQIVLTAPQDSVRLSDFMRQISPYSSIAVTKLQQHTSPHIPSLQSSSDVCFSEPQVFFPSSVNFCGFLKHFFEIFELLKLCKYLCLCLLFSTLNYIILYLYYIIFYIFLNLEAR